MTSHTTPSIHTCNIAKHDWLVLQVNELLAHHDLYGIVRGLIDMNEYSVEVPDFVHLVITDTISLESVENAFRRWFGDCIPCENCIMDFKIGLQGIRKDWLQWRTESPNNR
jgi:hypothetical protein